ncbi:MAG: hypothetical protein H7A35_05790 [Planctomycetales bacterium]|nr:hypothetical protein [bacterium]UNM09571.1 MAG: hypothetical protein H7A35_05790 [Planctomycetales bacterium]
MKNTGFRNNAIGLLAAVITSLTIASCGGGGASAPLPGDNGLGNGNGVAAGTTNVNGTVLQGTDVKASSAVGDGMAGLLISLINTSTGQLMGTDVTDSLGKYEFKGIPSGDGYLVKIEFKSTQDLDGDGRLDEIELYFPVDLANQAVTDLLQQIGVSDSDSDGQLDALEVEFHLNDDKGNSESSHRQHRRRGGETRVDDNNDGSFDDSFDDSDGDGLPDTSFSGGSIDDSSNSGLHELEVKGLIESISADSITVGGSTFALSSSTVWRIGDNRNADPAQFTAGTFVEVEGFTDGNGGWIASKVKTEDGFIGSGSGSGDDSGIGSGTGIDELEVKGFIEKISDSIITVAGQDFDLSDSTVWRIGDDRNADPALFMVGMFVEITGDLSGDSWHARRVKLEDDGISGGNGGDDNGGDDIGDDNGGNGNDDGAGDDNGGGNDDGAGDDNGGGNDDGAGDDNGGDDMGDDNGGDDDNSGKGGDDDGEDDDNSGKGGGDDSGNDN